MELVAPAGNLPALDAALEAGADSIYVGFRDQTNARAFPGLNFSDAELIEGIRRAQEKYGKKPLTGEQVRWGLENLAIDEKRIKALGFEGFMLPLSTSCADHMGVSTAMMMQWDGNKWNTDKKIWQADMAIIKPMIDQAAKKYAAEKKIEYRDCAKDAG